MRVRKYLAAILLSVMLIAVLSGVSFAEETAVGNAAMEELSEAAAPIAESMPEAVMKASAEPVAEAAEPAPAEEPAPEAAEPAETEPAPEAAEPAEPAPAGEPAAEAAEPAEPAPAEESAAEMVEPAEPEPAGEPAAETTENPAEAPTGTAELPGAPAPAEESPVELPEGSSPELTGENSTTCYAAQFYGLNDSSLTLRNGEEMELSELVSSLGYEGEIESALSSNPEVLEIADGIVRILNPFGDEKITLIINGQEVTIRVHDPEGTPVTAENIVDSFSTGGTYHLSSDVTVSNGSLIIPTGKEVILDLNGFALKGKDGTTGSVITVNGTFTLNDSSAANSGVITGGTGTTDSEGHFFSGGGVYNSGTFNMNGGSITGITDNMTSWGFSGGGVYNSGTFNMTGGSISNNSLAQTSLAQGGGVYNSGTFNMTGGTICDNSVGTRTGEGYGGGVYNSGTFNMSNDAQITGNTAPKDGGGIYNYSGRFSMTGGKITGNTSEKRGGGVFWLPTRSYVTPVVEITMTGGEITGNTAREGGGVWFNGTACTFGGDVKITGNTDGIVGSKAESNLFLANGSIMLDVATGDDAPRIGMRIGVTTADKPAPGELLAVSTKHIAAEEYFRSDDPAYWFVDVDERLRLVNAAEDPRVAYVAETGMVYSKVQSAINTIPREKAWTVIMHGDSMENLLIDYRSVPEMTLDLNGHTLRGTGKGSVITIEGGKLTLNDSSSAKSGVITGGNAECGGGVYIWGAARLIMTGGTITGNTATKDGGGVYSDCDLRLTGGVITGNSAGENGGGVYNDGGVQVGGDAKIIGNTAGKEGSMTDNNLYLVREKYVAYAAVPNGMRIGVTAARAPTADSPFTITTIRVQAGDEAYFISDNSSYLSVFDSKDEYIKLIYTHQHDWSYSLGEDKASVTAVCAKDDCPLTDTLLTIAAESTVYDGLAHGASFVQSSFCGSALLPEISYQLKNGGTVSTDKPVNAGTYVASFTVGSGDKAVTASVEFTVAKAVPAASDFNYTSPGDTVYDGTSRTAKVEAASGKTGMGQVTVRYFDASGNEISAPTNAGEYTVKITAAEGENFLATPELLTDDNWNFTVVKATPTADDFAFTSPQNMEYDGTDKTAKVTFASETKTGMGKITVRYFDASGNEISAPTNAGEYTVKITVSEGENYSSVPALLTKDGWKFNVTKATPAADDFCFTPPGELVYDGTAKTAKVTFASDTKTGMGNITVRYFDASGNEISGNGPKDAGTYTVKLSVAEGDNYTGIPELLADKNWQFTLAKAQLTVTGTSVEGKTYDGTTDATVKEAGTLSGFLDSDDVGLKSAAATFKDANAGKGKTVTVQYILDGDDAGNYVVSDNTSLTADIDPLQLSVTGTTVSDKAYDGTTDARATVGKIIGILDADLARMTVTASANFDTPDIGADKEVTVVYSLRGDSALNYIAPENDVLTASILERPASPTEDTAEGVSVYVDDELLTEGIDYNWVNGKVVLTAQFLETLEAGEHVLRAEFPGFSTAETFSFTDGTVVPAEDAKYLAV